MDRSNIDYESTYDALNFTDFSELPVIDRRDFMKQLGGGILIFICFGDLVLAQDPGRRRGQFRRGRAADFNAFLRIDEDGRVSCFSGKVEMGQGITTSLAQMVADELDTPLESVDMVLGDTDRCPWDMGTFGSMTTRIFGPSLRNAAAEARGVLVSLGSQKLGIPEDQLKTEGGAVVAISDSSRRVSYGALARGQQIQKIVDKKTVLKSLGDYKVSGKSIPRSDAHDKVTGRAQYSADIRFPGLLYARIVRPPAHGATLKSIDTSAAEAMDGVRVVRDGALVAVLHETPDGAARALAAVKTEFETPPAKIDDASVHAHLLANTPRGDDVGSGGSIERGNELARKLIESEYLDDYTAHAPMEPHAAVAKVDEKGADVWASTQAPFRGKSAVARALELPEDKVRIRAALLGGGFGGKSNSPQIVEAARLSKLAGKPVQVAWTREEEFFYDRFKPAAVVKIASGLTEDGRLCSWDYGVHHAGSRGARHFYDIPHHRSVVYGSGWRGRGSAHPLATGAWRAPANNTNTFARESQIDVMAAAAGTDPLEFRLAHLKDERMRRVLEAVAKKFGWTPAKGPSGRGHGIACGIDAGAYVATMAEVKVDESTGDVLVVRVACAQDLGEVINPDGAVTQIEGCITMGLGYALKEKVHFEGGAIRDLNFDSYQLPRFSWVPRIDCVLIDAGEGAEPQGGGEPAIITVGGVIANAVFDAVGARVYHLPMTADRVKEAMVRG